jgi:hypothetical protein
MVHMAPDGVQSVIARLATLPAHPHLQNSQPLLLYRVLKTPSKAGHLTTLDHRCGAVTLHIDWTSPPGCTCPQFQRSLDLLEHASHINTSQQPHNHTA